MIWRTFFSFNLGFQFYQQYMWFNHKQLCLTQSIVCLNTISLFSRNQFIQFNLLCSLVEYCKQTKFTCFNKMKRRCCFLNMCKVLLFCCIKLTLIRLQRQIKVLVFVKQCCETEIYIIRTHWWWCSASRFASERDLFISKLVWWNSDWIFSFQSIWQFCTRNHHFKQFQIIWYCLKSSCVFNFKHSPVIQRQLFENCTSIINYQVISSLCSRIIFSIQFRDCRNWLVFQIKFKSSCCIKNSSFFNDLCSASLCKIINSTKMIQFWICYAQTFRQNIVLTCICWSNS